MSTSLSGRPQPQQRQRPYQHHQQQRHASYAQTQSKRQNETRPAGKRVSAPPAVNIPSQTSNTTIKRSSVEMAPKQPLYQYIRPNKDSYITLSPSSPPASRPASLDLPRPLNPPTATTPNKKTKRRSNFLDIPFHEGMTTDQVVMPGPDSLTPPGQNPPQSFFHGSIGGRTEQMMKLAAVPRGSSSYETASGTYRSAERTEKNKKEEKKKGWKRLSLGLKTLVGRP